MTMFKRKKRGEIWIPPNIYLLQSPLANIAWI
jgi:hypothetical protein